MMSAAAVVASLVLSMQVSAQVSSTSLLRCRELDNAFDTKGMVKPCETAAQDATLPAPDRAEAWRRLAFAHTVNGDEGPAEAAFVRMLVYDPDAVVPPESSPKLKEVFARAQGIFGRDGLLEASFKPPVPSGAGPVPVQLDVTDRLGRVASVRVRATRTGAAVDGESEAAAGAAVEERLVRAELAPGLWRFNGAIPDDGGPGDVSYELILDGHNGEPLPVTGADLKGTYSRAAPGAFPWLWVGVGTGVVATAAALTGGGVALCFLAGPCNTQDASVRVRIERGAP